MRNITKLVAILLSISVLLCAFFGCNPNTSGDAPPADLNDQQSAPIGATFGSSLSESELPAPITGLLLTEPLAVEPWNSSRCAATSYCSYGEVETGFYGTSGMSLAYAEKRNLDDWLVVCPYADCQHFGQLGGCPATVDGCFIVHDNRIYYPGSCLQYEDFWIEDPEPGAFYFLASVALDGTDTRPEYIFDSSGITLGKGAGVSMYVSTEYAIYCRTVLNDTGLYDAHIFILDESGEHLVYDEDIDFQPGGGGYAWALDHNTFGDRMFLCGILDPTWQIPFILTEDYTIEQVDLTGLPEEGAYLSDNIYRCFRANDGYYDVNLETREETKLEEAQLENSHAFVVLPNCILESTLMGYTSLPMQSNVQQNAMKLFDGQRWWDVELPEELLEVKGKYLDVEAVTSDRILFCLRDGADPMNLGHVLYQIFLGTDRPVMEYAGTVEYQELPESW